MPSKDELRDRVLRDFAVQDINGEQIERTKLIRLHYEALALRLVDTCPVSRELSLAITTLEESLFWAAGSVLRNEGEK